MKDLVLSVEQCRHLQELGLDMSDAKMTHVIYLKTAESIEPNLTNEELREFNHDYEFIPTYTFQEIWEKLPELINCYEDTYYLTARKDSIYYADVRGNHYKTFDRISILYSAYEALCWVLENGYLKK